MLFQVYYSNTIPSRRRLRARMDEELKCRENPVLFKLDSIVFKNIFSPEVVELKKLFDKYNYEIRIAGGAVRYIV